MKLEAPFAALIFLTLLCRVSLSEEQIGQPNQEIPDAHVASSLVGPITERDEEGPVGVGESRGNLDVGVPAVDPDSRQSLPGPYPPPRIVAGPPRPSFPPGQFPPAFPPQGAFDGSLGSLQPTGSYPGPFPGQFPPRPPRPPLSGGPFPPAPYPQRPFPGQRPPRPPPPPYGNPFPSLNPFAYPPLPAPSEIVNRAVASVADFDDRRCVARLLCELTSGSMPGVYSGGYRPYRPYYPPTQSELFVGQEQLLQLLAALALGNPQASPLSSFGGAALLGISSRGRPEHCYRAFPECPQDSDGLLDYLNNHRGGFFKAIGEPLRPGDPQSPDGPVPRPPLQPPGPYPQGPQQPYPTRPLGPLNPRPLNYYSKSNSGGLVNNTDSEYTEVDNSLAASGESEPRIQVHPDRIVGLINSNRPLRPGDWRFPLGDFGLDSGVKNGIFPPAQNVLGTDFNHKGLRKGKKLAQFAADPQIPVPSLPPSMHALFPDRTGTGDLRLDNSELFGNKNRPGQSSGDSNGGTRYGRVYFPREIDTVTRRPGEINTRFYIIFPGPAN